MASTVNLSIFSALTADLNPHSHVIEIRLTKPQWNLLLSYFNLLLICTSQTWRKETEGGGRAEKEGRGDMGKRERERETLTFCRVDPAPFDAALSKQFAGTFTLLCVCGEVYNIHM